MKEKHPLRQKVSALFADTSPFMTAVGQLALLAVLNLCLVVTGLPVVTLGAALTALYAVLAQRRALSFAGAFTAFFRALWRRWRPATLCYLAVLATGAPLVLYLRLLLLHHLTDRMLLLLPLLLLGALWAMTVQWVFPLLALTNHGAVHCLGRACLLGLRELWRSLLLLALDAVPLVLFFLYAQLFMTLWGFWCLLGFALLALVKFLVMEPVLRPLQVPSDTAGRS